jgi:hypothetical protein
MKHGIILIIAICLIASLGVYTKVGADEKNFSPSVNAKFDLGKDGREWKDIYHTGDIYSNDIKVIDSGTVVATTLTLGAEQVKKTMLATNAVTLTIAAGATYNTVTVDSTSLFAGHYISTVGSINGLNLINAPVYEGSGVWKISMVNAIGPNPGTFTLNFIDNN